MGTNMLKANDRLYTESIVQDGRLRIQRLKE